MSVKGESEDIKAILLDGVISALKKNDKSLVELDLSGYGFTDDDIEKLVSTLDRNFYLKSIDLSKNGIGKKGASSLAKTRLAKIDLSHNSIGDKAVSELAKSSFLTELRVNHCHLSGACLDSLAGSRSLAHLSIGYNKLGDADFKSFARSRNLKEVVLDGVELKEDIIRTLLSNRTISMLSLKSCGVDNDGLSHFEEKHHVKALRLDSNSVNAEGLKSLVKMDGLRTLAVSNNLLGSGAFEWLKQIDQLKVLSLANCDVKADELSQLADHKSLLSVDLLGNHFEKISQEAHDGVRALQRRIYLNNQLALIRENRSDITEINLNGLSINDDQVKEIVSALKRNGYITTLQLDENLITDTGAAHLAKHLKIRTISLKDNQIGDSGAIALTRNGHIKTLKISDNALSSRGVTELCKESSIKNLDLSRYDIDLDIATLIGKNRVLKSIDLNLNGHKLANDALEALSKARNLSRLSLKECGINDNGVELISRISSLKTLALDGNWIGEAGAEHLLRLTELQNLHLAGNQLGFAGALVLAKHPSIRLLDLENNDIGSDGATAFESHPTLKTLELSVMEVDDDRSEKLFTKLNQRLYFNKIIADIQKRSKDMTIADLSGVSLTMEQLDQLLNVLQQNSNIVSVKLDGCLINDEMAECISNKLRAPSLSLSRNRLTEKGAEHLAKNRNVIELNLASNELGDKGAFAIARAGHLKSLNLDNNEIDVEGALALSRHRYLISLSLADNMIGNEGAFACLNNRKLEHLVLDGNQIDDEVLLPPMDRDDPESTVNFKNFSVDELTRHSNLRRLSIANNFLTSGGVTHLCKFKNLVSLNLRSNPVGNLGASIVAADNKIEELDLSYCSVDDHGASFFENHPSITSLSLRSFEMTDVGCSSLAKNPKLVNLEILTEEIGSSTLEKVAMRIEMNRQRGRLIRRGTTNGEMCKNILGIAGGIAQIGVGISITVLTGGWGTSLGSSLIASGLNTTVYSTKSTINDEAINGAEYAIQSAVAAISGAATAGVGLWSSQFTMAAVRGELARQTALRIAQNTMVDGGVGLAGSFIQGGVESVFRLNGDHFYQSLSPIRVFSSLVGGIAANHISAGVGRGISKRVLGDQVDDAVLAATRQTVTDDMFELAVRTGTSSISGAAGAGASTMIGNLIRDGDASNITQGVGESMLVSAISGAANSAATQGQKMRQRNKLRKRLIEQAVVDEELKRSQGLLDNEQEKLETAKSELDEATSDHSKAAAELEARQMSLKEAEAASENLGQEKADQAAQVERLEQERQAHQLAVEREEAAQKLLDEKAKHLADQTRAQERRMAEYEDAYQQMVEKKQAFEKEKREVEARIREQQQAVDAQDAEVEALERSVQSYYERKDAVGNMEFEIKQLKADEQHAHSLKDPKRPEDVERLIKDVVLTWKKALKDIRAERTRLLDNVSKRMGPLRHDFENARRELRAAEGEIRKAGVRLDKSASEALRPVREKRDQARKELDNTVEQLKRIEKELSKDLAPVRKLRDDAVREAKDFGGRSSSAFKKAQAHASNELQPLKDKSKVIQRKVKDTGKAVRAKAKEIELHVVKELEPAKRQLTKAQKSVNATTDRLQVSAKKYQKQLAVDMKPLTDAVEKGEAKLSQHSKKIREGIANLENHVADKTRPLSRAIEQKVAPTLKKGVEHTMRGRTLLLEGGMKATAKGLQLVGDDASSRRLLKQSDALSRGSKKVGKTYAEAAGKMVTARVAKAALTVMIDPKGATKVLENEVVRPISEALRADTSLIGDTTRPFIEPLERKVAPVLQKGVEKVVRSTTVPAEATMKLVAEAAGAVGDQASKKRLLKQSDQVSRASQKVAEHSGRVSGKIVTAKNAAVVGATVAGSMVGIPIGGALAASVVKTAQGDTVTGKDVLLNVASAAVGAEIGSQVTSSLGNGVASNLAGGAANGAARSASRHILDKVASSNPADRRIDLKRLGNEMGSGALSGAVSSGTDLTINGSDNFGAQVLNSAVSQSADSALNQLANTGKVDMTEIANRFVEGGINEGFNGAVSGRVQDLLRPVPEEHPTIVNEPDVQPKSDTAQKTDARTDGSTFSNHEGDRYTLDQHANGASGELAKGSLEQGGFCRNPYKGDDVGRSGDFTSDYITTPKASVSKHVQDQGTDIKQGIKLSAESMIDAQSLDPPTKLSKGERRDARRAAKRDGVKYDRVRKEKLNEKRNQVIEYNHRNKAIQMGIVDAGILSVDAAVRPEKAADNFLEYGAEKLGESSVEKMLPVVNPNSAKGVLAEGAKGMGGKMGVIAAKAYTDPEGAVDDIFSSVLESAAETSGRLSGLNRTTAGALGIAISVLLTPDKNRLDPHERAGMTLHEYNQRQAEYEALWREEYTRRARNPNYYTEELLQQIQESREHQHGVIREPRGNERMRVLD